MNLVLFRKQRCVRMTLLIAPLVTLFALTLALGLRSINGRFEEIGSEGGVRVEPVWSWGVGILLLPPIATAWAAALASVSPLPRVPEWERALPLSNRVLLGTHLAALLFSLIVPVAAAVLAVAFALARTPVMGQVLLQGGNCVASSILVGVLCFAWRPRARFLSSGDLLVIAVLGCAILAVTFLADQRGIGLVNLGIALWAYHWFRVSAPSFDSASPGKGGLRRGVASRGFPGLGWVPPLHRVLLRSTMLRPIGFGQLLGIVFLAPTLRAAATNLWVLPFLLWNYGRCAIQVLRGIDPLPIDRRRLLPYVVLPPLLALSLGLLALRWYGPRSFDFDGPSDRVILDGYSEESLGEDREYATHVRVPSRLWELHLGRTPVRTEAPWGESTRLLAHPLFWGAPISVVNPYDVEPGNSLRFLAWQLSRAIRDASGETRSEESLAEDLLADERPEVVLQGSAATIADLSHPSWKFRGEKLPNTVRASSGVPFGLVAAGLLWVLTMGFVLRRNVPPATPGEARRRRVRRWISQSLLWSLLILLGVLEVEARTAFQVLPAVLEHRIDAFLGFHLWAWILLDAVVLLSGYFFAMACLRRIEVPVSPRIGWNRRRLRTF